MMSDAGPSTDIQARTASKNEPQYHMGRRVVSIKKYPFRQAVGPPEGEWTTGICGCCADQSILCCALFCPCIQAGRNIEIISGGQTDAVTASLLSIVSILSCLYTCGYRRSLREKYLLPEKPCGDCVTHCFLGCCALSQEGRELKNRGWDPALGFAGNIKAYETIGIAPPSMMMTK